jgi:hypothetical protein
LLFIRRVPQAQNRECQDATAWRRKENEREIAMSFSTGGTSRPHPQAMLVTNPMVTTALELPGYKVVRNLGVA